MQAVDYEMITRWTWRRVGCLLLVVAMFGIAFPATSGANCSRKVFGVLRNLVEAREAWAKGRAQTAIRLASLVVRDSTRAVERAGAYHVLCVVRTARGELDTALRHCDRAVSLTRDQNWRHLNNRGNVLVGMGRVSAAVEDYDAALALLRSDEAERGAEERLASAELLQANRAVASRAIVDHASNRASASGSRSSGEAAITDPRRAYPQR
jgi:tetratricopeptide (TPR) repeat protein